MLRGGTIRRVRQTLIATNLADGALVAWRVPEERLDAAFDFILKNDPFTGHVVLRSTDAEAAGSGVRAAEIKPSEISPALYRDWFTRMKG